LEGGSGVTIDEIFARVYDVINMFELMPYIRAGIIIAVTAFLVRQLFTRG